MTKKFFSFILTFIFICFGTISLSACKNKNNDMAYISLDINPEIEIIVDKNNNVVSVRGENQDGIVLLYDETGIVGKKLDTAVEKIMTLASEYGFISQENSVVDLLVTSENDKLAKKATKKVNVAVSNASKDLEISISTSTDGAYSLVRKFEEFKEKYPNNPEVQALDIEKFKLALSVSETGEISLEMAITLSEKELIELLKQESAKIEAYATQAYLQAKAQAYEAYQKIIDKELLHAYSSFYLNNVLSHLTTAYYGGAYQMYKTASIGLNAVCDVLEFGTQIENYPLDDTQISAVLTALGMEQSEIDKLKNQNGEITISSIESYVDVLFKNSEASDALNQVKAQLTTALKGIEQTLTQKAEEFIAKNKDKIQSAKNALNEAVATFNSVIPSQIQETINTLSGNLFNDMNSAISTLTTLLGKDKIAIEDLREVANKCEKKASEYLEKIKADLSKEELLWIENKKQELAELYSGIKQEFENAMQTATAEAKAEIQNIKNQLKSSL